MADHPKSRAIPSPLIFSGNPRKTNPSPLQVSTIPTPIKDHFTFQPSPQGLPSPYNRVPQSPRSPYSPMYSGQKEDFSSGPLRHGTQHTLRDETKSSPSATPRVINQPQRTVSGPASASAIADSPPASSSDLVPPGRNRIDLRPTERLALRTSSIDSTMSTISSATSASANQDPLSPNPFEIQQLIASAGSPEALIKSLVKEKQTAAQQNVQLWRLINKQRHLIMGLNSDLAKAAEDRERYQNRCKELAAAIRLPPAQQIQQLRRTSLSASSSPARSEHDLPIQRHSILPPVKAEHRRSVSVDAGTKAGLSSLQEVGSAALESHASSTNTSPSYSGESKTRVTPDSEASDEGAESRRNTIMQTRYQPISPVAPLEIKKMVPAIAKILIPSVPSVPSQPDSAASPSSFSIRRSMAAGKLVTNSPVVGSSSENVSSPARKGPPARLNLKQKQSPPKIIQPLESPVDDTAEPSDSDYNDIEVDEIPAFERGRKKTRDEDDREREYISVREAESRSQSKLEKRPKSATSKSGSTPLASPDPTPTIPRSPAIHAFSPNGSSAIPASFPPHASLDGMLSAPASGVQTTTLIAPPVSPGLPRSPRPSHRPQNSPKPRAPHEANVLSPPLSMRGSSTLSLPGVSPILLMPQTPTSMPSPRRPSKSDPASSLGSKPSPSLNTPEAVFHAELPVQSATPQRRSPASPKSPGTRSPIQTPGLQRSVGYEPIPQKTPTLQKSPNLERSEGSERSIRAEPLARVASESSSITMPGGIYRGLASEAYPDLLLPPNALPSISVKVTSSRLRPSRHSILSIKAVEEEPVFTLGITARSDMRQLWRIEKPILALPQLDSQLKQASPFDIKLPDRSLFAGHAPSKIDARRVALERYFEDILDTPMNERAGLILCHFLSMQAIPAEEFEGGMISGTTADGHHPIHQGPDGKIIKEGYLTKRGKNFGGWKARYFVLDEPTLRYYESPGGALLGQIKLIHAQLGRQSSQSSAAHSPARAGEESDKEFRHAFLILEPKKKDSSSMLRHVLCAENDVERDEWVDALLQYIGQPYDKAKSKGPRNILTSMMKNKDESPVPSSNRDDPFTLQGMSYENTVAGQPVRSGPLLDTASPIVSSSNNMPGHIQSAVKTTSGPTISGPTGATIIQDAMAWGLKVPESPKSRDKEKKRSLWGFRDKADTASQSSGGSSVPPPRPTLPPGAQPVFGMSLAEAVEVYPIRGAEINLPSVVYRCLEYLESKDAASEEGIFRLSGSNLTIKALKERFNNEGDLDFLAEDTYYDVHAIASLLKMYLRELPGSVLGPRELHIQFQQVLELETREAKIAAFNVLVHRLPPANWTLMRSLSAFLIGIVNNSNVNKMTVRNVGIVFSPTLNIPSPLFAAFLTDFEAIFTAEPPAAAALSPVMEDIEPGTVQHVRKHILHDSRPPQSRDGSVQKRSRSRTRSRTPDRSSSSQGQFHQAHDRRSSIEDMRGPPQLNYPPPQMPSLSQHGRQLSREEIQALAMARQRSEDGVLSGLAPPGETRPKRDSIAPGLAATNIMRDAKARRRESSMLMMGPSGGGGGSMAAESRKSSLPSLRQ